MLKTVRRKRWQKTQLWGLYKTQYGSHTCTYFVSFEVILVFEEPLVGKQSGRRGLVALYLSYFERDVSQGIETRLV